MSLILKPFSLLLVFFYNLFNSYGLALIFFAIVVKIVLFPFSLKGKKSMVKMNMLSGRAQRLQQQYANNKEKYQEELAKLYEKEQVNPMGGCLWSFLPLLLLLPLYAIIRQPMTHMMDLAAEQIVAVANNVLNWSQVALDNGWIREAAALTEQTSGAGYYQLYMASLINEQNLAAVRAVAPGAFAINFDFLGMNLAQVPTWQFWTQELNWNNIGLTLMPIVSAALSLLMSVVMQKTNKMSNPQAAQAGGTNNFMMYALSPIMSLWIGYVMPAGLCVYWIINSLLSMVQEVIAGQLLKKDYAAAAEAARKQELLDKEEEKRKKAALAAERAKRAEEKKQKGKKKDKAKEPAPGVDASASRVGIRAYARGRAYDPARFGGVTPYRDPDHPVDEEAIEKARSARAEKAEEAKLEADVTARVAAEMADLAEGTADQVEQAIEKLDQERSEALMEEAAALAAAVTVAPAGEPAEETPEETTVEESAGETPAEEAAGEVTPAPKLETPKYDAPDYTEEKKDE